jgi:signal transduction histidine kinase
MTVSTQLHLAAGIGALVMGIACLMADPGRRRNRLFSALCFAMALWTLGKAAMPSELFQGPGNLWGIRLFLFGSCAAAPLGLHFSLALCWPMRKLPTMLLVAAYSVAAGLWSATWFRPVPEDRSWKIAAILVLGAILAIALGLLVRKTLSLPTGPERVAYRLVTLASFLAVFGGLSDFMPRAGLDYPKVGPVALILFVLVVSGVVLRHRFLDVDRFLVQAAALIAGAGVFAMAVYGALQLLGDRFLTLFIVCLAVLLLMPSTARLLVAGARGLVTRQGPLADAFAEVSRNLPGADSPERIWEILREGRKQLPEGSEVILYLHDSTDGTYRPESFRRSEEPGNNLATIAADHPVPMLLARNRCPIHRRLLEEDIRETEAGQERGETEEVLAWCMENRLRLVVPIFADEELRGWIAVAGIPSSWITADLAASIQAVGNQAVASIDRLAAIEAGKRRQALATVGEMAAGLAHEIRNPLAAIRGATQAINPEASMEQSREMLEIIDEESDRLGRVVGEFLEYARPGSPRKEPVDLVATARKVTRDAGLAGYDLAVEIQDPGRKILVSGDPDQIRRAFENLVRNAWEAGGEGTSLTIRAGDHADRGNWIEFRDDGPGITPDNLPKLFQPFFTTRSSGTGLGLALIHRIMEAHGGTVEVNSRQGEGTVFTLFFPGDRHLNPG